MLIRPPYRARAPESACVDVSAASVGLTESPGRVNGIRLTRVIQLGCGREVCPHPAGGDKEPGEGWGRGRGGGPFHHFTGNSTKFQFQFVCHRLISAWALTLANI